MLSFRTLVFAVLTPCVTAASPAAAQLLPPGPADDPAEHAVLSLDTDALLTSNEVFPDRVNDPVWNLTPQEGRRLFKLPLRIERVTGTAELRSPPIDVRGGRFVAWHITGTDAGSGGFRGGAGRGGYGGDPYSGGYGGDPYDSGYGGDPYGGRQAPVQVGPRGQFNPQQRPQASPRGQAAESDVAQVPPGAPQLARKIVLTPDGRLSWSLDRSIPGAEVNQSNDGYVLKVRPDRLAEMEPQRPGADRRRQTLSRGNPGASRPTLDRGAIEQRREAEARYRQELEQYRDLRTAIRDLPDEFSVPAPPMVWAVFEVPEALPELTLNGEDPLPWAISFEDLTAMRAAAGRSFAGGDGRLDFEGLQLVSQLSLLAREGHPLTHRLIADIVVRAGLAGRAQPNDPLYRLLGTLIESEDAQASRTVTAALAAVEPSTSATVMLLRDAARRNDPGVQIAALRGLLRGDPDNPSHLQDMLASATRLLRDEQGPPAGEVVRGIVEGLPGESEALSLFVSGVDFATLSAARREQAIRAVAQAAGTSALASAWLDKKLLGSDDEAVRRQTLEVLATTAGGESFARPVADAFLALFGNTDAAQPAVSTRPLRLNTPLPIDSAEHALLDLLRSDDDDLRTLAWRSLPAFRIGPPDGSSRQGEATGDRGRFASRGSSTGSADDTDEIYRRLMEAAMSQRQTPKSLAHFLADQPHVPRATEALCKLVITGDSAASASAARKLIGSDRPLDQILPRLGLDERSTLAARLYEAVDGEHPPVVGLLRQTDERAAVLGWFANQVVSGTLPPPAAWAEPFNDEQQLLQLAGAPDAELAAGAVAALVYAAGGDARTAREMIARFANAGDRTVDGLRSIWSPAKQQIFARRLASAAGRYRLVLEPVETDAASSRDAGPAYGADPYGGDPYSGDPYSQGYGGPPPSDAGPSADSTSIEMPDGPVQLGVVELLADGQSVQFRGDVLTVAIPDERLALRLPSPGELKGFDHEDLASLSLERVSDPVDLLPLPDGSWQGTMTLGRGQTLRVRLEPVTTP